MLGVLNDFEIIIREFEVKIGVGFIVVLIGVIMIMFGLLKKLVVLNMDVIDDGKVIGFF